MWTQDTLAMPYGACPQQENLLIYRTSHFVSHKKMDWTNISPDL